MAPAQPASLTRSRNKSKGLKSPQQRQERSRFNVCTWQGACVGRQSQDWRFPETPYNCFRHPRIMTTANKITVVRILMIPAFVTMAIYYGESIQAGSPLEWQRYAAIAIFLLAAVSDGLDGYVARHYNQRSSLGVILDPIADKGLLLSGIITLSITRWGELRN